MGISDLKKWVDGCMRQLMPNTPEGRRNEMLRLFVGIAIYFFFLSTYLLIFFMALVVSLAEILWGKDRIIGLPHWVVFLIFLLFIAVGVVLVLVPTRMHPALREKIYGEVLGAFAGILYNIFAVMFLIGSLAMAFYLGNYLVERNMTWLAVIVGIAFVTGGLLLRDRVGLFLSQWALRLFKAKFPNSDETLDS